MWSLCANGATGGHEEKAGGQNGEGQEAKDKDCSTLKKARGMQKVAGLTAWEHMEGARKMILWEFGSEVATTSQGA